MALIFDTETNGLPICKSYSEFPCYTDLSKYNSARLVQISYIITNNSLMKEANLESSPFAVVK